jgi:hypothetical protein
MKSQIKAILALSIVSLSLVPAGSARADYDTVLANTYSQMCPTHIGGDREYNGHGPNTTTNITLRRAGGTLILGANMHQKETVSDWSEAKLNKDIVLSQRFDGKQYTHIWAPNSAGVFVWTAMPNFSFYDGWTDFYVDTNHSTRTVSPPKFWLQSVTTNGDTGGKDIGNCTWDDAYLTIKTKKIFVQYQ